MVDAIGGYAGSGALSAQLNRIQYDQPANSAASQPDNTANQASAAALTAAQNPPSPIAQQSAPQASPLDNTIVPSTTVQTTPAQAAAHNSSDRGQIVNKVV